MSTSIDLIRSLVGKTVVDFHVGANRADGQPVMVTLWFDSGPPILIEADDDGLVVSVDTLDDVAFGPIEETP